MNKINYLVVIGTMIISSCNYVGTNNNEGSKDKNQLNIETKEKHELIKGDQEVELIDSNRCNLDIVLEIDEDLDNLTDKQINLFLYSFDKSCANNAEFGEYSNEMLFKVLNKYPELVAKNMLKEGIQKDVILEELSSPVSELSNIKDTYNAVLKAKIKEDIKGELLKALKEE